MRDGHLQMAERAWSAWRRPCVQQEPVEAS
jgi:hypothetical protein